MRTVAIPSRRKIQRQPARPPMPSRFSIANANKPEKAPARDAAEKKTAIRVWISKRQYQLLLHKFLIRSGQAIVNGDMDHSCKDEAYVVKRYVAAGKNPDSANPRRSRVTTSCS